ncbi:MAG: hypothetical protein QXL51_01370 [Candidatus Aenigmatarchaeota archaeon]
MAELEKFIAPIAGILVGVAMIPVISSYIQQANLTGNEAILVGLIPFFYSLGVFLYTIRGIVF